MHLADGEGLAEATRPSAELPDIIEPAPGSHCFKTSGRLNHPDQDCTSGLVKATDDIQIRLVQYRSTMRIGLGSATVA